jgi:hypothetical protein
VKLAVAALVRNEIDIIGTFLRHLDALFDYALLMDHGSIDGTDRAIDAACERRAGWTMWHIDALGYHQSAFSSIAVAHLMQHTDADVVVLLDADEFINVPDRASLVAAFCRLTDPDGVGSLVWLNAVPGRLDTRLINAGDTIWLPACASRLGKAVIPRVFHARHGAPRPIWGLATTPSFTRRTASSRRSRWDRSSTCRSGPTPRSRPKLWRASSP